MPDPTMADLLAAQAGAPGPVYEGGPTGNVRYADVLAALGLDKSWLDRAQKQAGTDVANYQQGGVPGLLADRGETADLAGGFGGVTRDPKLWHGISQVKLPRPISEMSASIEQLPVSETRVTPAQLQGGQLLPAIGDRSAASGTLTGFNGFEFANPVELQGGHGYMPANTERGVVWAGKQGPISTIQKRAEALAQGGGPVYFPYTAMGERAVDFSHMPAEALIEALPSAKITRQGRTGFNEAMRGESKDFGPLEDWPGIGSQGLREYLANAPGYARTKFVQTIDKAGAQEAGFPSAAEARFAVTDPRLLDAPVGASGLSISKIDPGPAAESAHKTYQVGLPGEYVGGFGTSVPRELMYPDIIKALEEYRANMPAGKKTPTIEYLMRLTPKGLPIAQPANQQWVDTVSAFLRSKGLLPAAGLTVGAAATMSDEAKAEPSPADVIGAQTGSPGPVYENKPTGNVSFSDVLSGLAGPTWLDKATQQMRADAAAYQRGGVPALMADTQRPQDLAGGFGGTITPAKGIRAYHGSPYDFEKFDLSKIGTGEGAQAYGHGLYFAENPQTAKTYRDSLSDLKDRFIEGTDLHLPSWVAKSLESGQNPAELLADFRGRVAQATEEMKTAHDPWNYPGKIEGLTNVVNAIEAHTKGAKIAPAGRMYEVNINAKPEDFLNFDNGGRKVYEDLARSLGNEALGSSNISPKMASQALQELGIPGIKYLDQGSRVPMSGATDKVNSIRNLLGAPDSELQAFGGRAAVEQSLAKAQAELAAAKPTSNYVVFNPDIVDIRKKWALLLAAMGGAGAPAMGDVMRSQAEPQR